MRPVLAVRNAVARRAAIGLHFLLSGEECPLPMNDRKVTGTEDTLVAGIAASMVTSIFVVRTFYMIWLNRNRSAMSI